MNLATKIGVKRRQKKARETLNRLRLKYYDFEGTDRFEKYKRLLTYLQKKAKGS